MQVTTKDIKKQNRLSMKPLPLKALCAKGVFQIRLPISGVNFPNNISIPQLEPASRNWTLHNLWNLLTINFKDKSFHNSIEWSGLYLHANIQPDGENFQIYSVKITGKCISVTLLLPPWHDLLTSFSYV